jgi:predicted metalloprotease
MSAWSSDCLLHSYPRGVYAAAGLGNIAALAPQAVYGHEFGHHIQFKNGYDAEAIPGQNAQTSAAELTRYTELMADAYSGYYLAHQNLGKTDKQQIRDAERAFFNLGDCAFDNPGHHGTPNQRQASVDFGIEVASRGGPTLTQQQFHALFFAKYPELIAPTKP